MQLYTECLDTKCVQPDHNYALGSAHELVHPSSHGLEPLLQSIAVSLNPLLEFRPLDHGAGDGPQIIVVRPPSVVMEHVGEVRCAREREPSKLLVRDWVIPAGT